MGRINRTAPDPEWVEMYVSGMPASRIAADAGAAEVSVRRHLAV